MTAKEMFEALGYKQVLNNDKFIEYRDDSHGDGDYKYIYFIHLWKSYVVGYFEWCNRNVRPTKVYIEEYEAITKQMKELGWL